MSHFNRCQPMASVCYRTHGMTTAAPDWWFARTPLCPCRIKLSGNRLPDKNRDHGKHDPSRFLTKDITAKFAQMSFGNGFLSIVDGNAASVAVCPSGVGSSGVSGSE